MDDKKRENIIFGVQVATVAGYILLVLSSTVGKYIKETKKNISRQAKRKDKLNKMKYKQDKKRLKHIQRMKKVKNR